MLTSPLRTRIVRGGPRPALPLILLRIDLRLPQSLIILGVEHDVVNYTFQLLISSGIVFITVTARVS